MRYFIARLIAFFKPGFCCEYVNFVKAKKLGVKVGSHCRLLSASFSTEPYLIEIGEHVTITAHVQFITHDGGVWVFRRTYPDIDLFGRIKIGDNVFIGVHAIILPGTMIGNNSIVAAGAVVKGVFEDNSIIAGIPAKRIGSIEDYYKKNKDKFVFVRNLSSKERRKILNKQISSI